MAGKFQVGWGMLIMFLVLALVLLLFRDQITDAVARSFGVLLIDGAASRMSCM
jgi:hypothetical protein|tara:strand:+ start:438 stop:596 length:159 start_codon:yes stop_codon:yes gene_type:complete